MRLLGRSGARSSEEAPRRRLATLSRGQSLGLARARAGAPACLARASIRTVTSTCLHVSKNRYILHHGDRVTASILCGLVRLARSGRLIFRRQPCRQVGSLQPGSSSWESARGSAGKRQAARRRYQDLAMKVLAAGSNGRLDGRGRPAEKSCSVYVCGGDTRNGPSCMQSWQTETARVASMSDVRCRAEMA